MPSVVIDLKNATDQRDVVHQAVAALADGKIVALPTETVYGLAVSALDGDAVKRLVNLKGRDPSKPFAFAIKSYEDSLDYVPRMSGLARRIARRCWPGPVTLVLPGGEPDSVIERLPEYVRNMATSLGTVGLRVPAHETTQQILRLLAGPIVLTSANFSNQEPCIDGDTIVEELGDDIDLIINDGRSRFGQASSVVQVSDGTIKVLRDGVIDEKTLNQMSGFIAVVVCTGNTCRSPMGEAIFKMHAAKKLGCAVDELENNKVSILSAGIAAMSGGSAARQAVEVMKEYEMNLDDHRSQPFTERLANFADVILTMTEAHRQAIIATWPQAASRTFVLRKDGLDVSDPIGLPVDVYRSTAEQISENLQVWVNELDFDPKEKSSDG
ncbi:MAG: L-threonylcarbamoyladenylate synthase [Planctomycetota bacterium]